jgi:SnoaL-like domain
MTTLSGDVTQDEIKSYVIQNHCARLSNLYCTYLDNGDYAAFETLWTEEGVFEHPAETYAGLAGIRKFLSARPVNKYMRHFCTNIMVDPTSDNSATGSASFLVLQSLPKSEGPPKPNPILFGHYQDEFERQDGVWKFKRRKLTGLRH